MFDATLLTLEKVLDLRAQAQQIHTSNIANANVPGFRAKKVDFDLRLRQALEPYQKDIPLVAKEFQTAEQVERVTADVYEDPLATLGADGNTVNPDHEQAEIAKNFIGYQTAIQLVNKKIALQKYILAEGGR